MRLQTRLALLFAAVVTAAAALMGTLVYAAISARLAAQVDDSLLDVSAPLARELADGRIPDEVADGPGRGDRRGESGLLLPTQLIRVDGSVSALDPTDVALPVTAADLALARSGPARTEFRDVTVDAQPYRVVTQALGDARGAVQVGRGVSENAEVLSALALLLTAIGAAVAALAALAGWLVARRGAARLVHLEQAAATVTSTGRLDATVPTAGRDEIARLGTAFNAMLVRLDQAREDQQRLVQDAGHELRTPLTSLRTNVSLLRQFEALPPQTRQRVLADLDGETRELSHLVDEIVHLAGTVPTGAPPEPVALAPVAHAAADRAARRTGRAVSVHADASVVIGQPAALERAVWNLVENACKFSAEGTGIELVVADGSVLVRDRGPGIDPADLPHVFDRFYRATAARSLPGSGLGLAIVADVAEAHGGRVRATNRAGGGAEIGMALPVVRPGADPG